MFILKKISFWWVGGLIPLQSIPFWAGNRDFPLGLTPHSMHLDKSILG